jgi:hypothetical protein
MTALAQNASASVEGTIYQFCVALDRCFALVPGQKVWIERFGDVTTHDQQIETKAYGDALTDNHLNFWKSLRNWLAQPFDDEPYATLVLVTTQPFGAQAKLAKWNSYSLQQRKKMLQEIRDDAEARFLQRRTSTNETKVSQVLSIQRDVLASPTESIDRILTKISIAIESPELAELRQKIVSVYGKGILDGKKADFLNSLLGYLVSAGSASNQGWEITYEDFTRHVQDCTALYRRETRIFPAKFILQGPTTTEESQLHLDKVFVKKLEDVEHFEAISEAIANYIAASKTVIEEFAHYEVPQDHYTKYIADLLALYAPRYRIACRSSTTKSNLDAQNFCDQLLSEESPALGEFHNPHRIFKNGVFHMLADDPKGIVVWKLK